MDGTIYQLERQKKLLERLIQKYKLELDGMPPGSLCLKQVGGRAYLYQQYYIKDREKPRHIQKMISPRNSSIAQSIKRKRFIEVSLPIFQKNVVAIDHFMKKYTAYDPEVIENHLPAVYQGLPMDCYSDTGLFSEKKWMEEPFDSNPMMPENLVHITLAGKKVRSKSEAIIAGILELNHVPFRYESALQLEDTIVYPDFTVLHPVTKTVSYWEHFGMTGNTEYLAAMDRKLQRYRSHGITPWNNLVTTYDSEHGSIDSNIIHNIVKAFFLL